jgi:class 3 adenylate cyclase
MTLRDLKDALADEISSILASDFQINVQKTASVPHSNDGAITFPNLDNKSQNCKLLETCVLYIDIRRSTELNMSHKPVTVAKLYSAFVRTMTQCARYYNGHVRGIIGDRVMVIYDTANAFTNAVNTAVLMNSVAVYILNTHFKRGEIICGIGIDSGNVLATKTGIRRRGSESYNYKNLVWLGRPANVASKLTDIANKTAENTLKDTIYTGYDVGLSEWLWRHETPEQFFQNFDVDYSADNRGLRSKTPSWRGAFPSSEIFVSREKTPAILMTSNVYLGFAAQSPSDDAITGNMFRKIDVSVSGYSGIVYGGDVFFKAFNPSP